MGSKLTDLTRITTADTGDLFYIVQTVGDTGASRAISRKSLDSQWAVQLSRATDTGKYLADSGVWQPVDSDLTSWAGVTRAAGFDTFATTPSSANLAALLTDETGTGANVFGTSPSFTTDIRPSSNDGASLGISGTAWSDLFLATGGVVNWAAGDVTITHASNRLDFAGASTGYTFDSVATVGSSTLLSGRTFTVDGATATNGQPAFAFNASGHTANSRVLGIIYDGNQALSKPGLVIQNLSDAGVFVSNSSVIWRDGGITLGAITATANPGDLLMVGGGIFATAGTTTIAPFKFSAGTNLTTAAAGAVEFDGTCLYATSVASSRQVVAAKQGAWATAVVALTNNIATAQNIFQAANDTITLAASTSYRFRARLGFNTGATTHTTAFGFGGTATFTSVDYISQATSTAANTLGTPQMRRVAAATASVLTATSTAVTTDIWIEGIVRVNGAGTLIPQVTFSAGPGGTCETAANSFIEFEPIGSNTVAAVGNWA